MIENPVFILSESVVGKMVRRLAYGAEVVFTADGIVYQTFVDDEDFIELEGYINE